MKTVKSMRTTSELAATRLRLGLTQDALALELGISKSLLSRAERRERSLPTSALVRLSALHVKLEAVSASRAFAAGEDWSAAERASMLKTAVEGELRCRLKAEQYQAELDKLQARYEQLCDSINKIDAILMDTQSSGGPGPLTDGHLEKHKNVLLTRLSKCGPKAQAALRHKVALQYAASHLHAMDAVVASATVAP